MNRLILVIIIYLAGVVFNLAVIAYFNERKRENYYPGIALVSWALLLIVPWYAIEDALESICSIFRFMFRKSK